jgi:serpin B
MATAVAAVLIGVAVRGDPPAAEPPSKDAKPEAASTVAPASAAAPAPAAPSAEELSKGIAAHRPSAKERAIEQALDAPCALDVDKTPLGELCAKIAHKHKVRVFIDAKALEDAGQNDQVELSWDAPELKLRSALNQLLGQLGLAWTIRDESLVISTHEKLSQRLELRVYEVADLIDEDDHIDSLIDGIKSTVAPTSWNDVGGPGSFADYIRGGAELLIVSQTREVQEEIAELLTALRATRSRTAWTPPLGPAKKRVARSGGFDESIARQLPPLPPDANRDAAAQASNELAIDLYRQFASGNRDNVFFSPYCISSAMSMLHAGARGETAAQLAKALRVPGENEATQGAQQALRQSILRHHGSAGTILRVANRLWGQKDYPFRAEYLDLLKRHYGGELASIDFTNSSGAAELINRWTAEQTANRIPTIMSASDIDPTLTRFVLTSAIYFKGRWQNPFSEFATKPDKFAAPSGPRDVQMMNQMATFDYLEIDGIQVLSLPYADRDLKMFVLLPGKFDGALAAVEKLLSAERVKSWCAGVQPQELNVYLPKFTIETGNDLKHSLKQLGVDLLFKRGDADLSNVSPVAAGIEPLWIQWTRHVASVEVNEEGTEAAAATAFGGAGFGGPSRRPEVFRADRPFLFVIRHEPTAAMLFMGRVTTPQHEAAPQGEGFF